MTLELFILSLVVNILTELGHLLVPKISLSCGLEKELGKLKSTLSSIEAGLRDAQRMPARGHFVSDWLGKLQDLCLDADDLLDEIKCEALRRQVVKDGRTSRKLRRFFSRRNPLAFRFNMSHQIKDIRERLKQIDDDKARFKCLPQDENNTVPASKLSDDQLPHHHLQRCFAYCSMFPKKYKFSRDDLIQFWMAHDLIPGNQDLEDIGEQYIKELQSRSFFQDVSYDCNFTFKMRDLMHDLAMSVAPSTCSTVNSGTKQDVSIRVRHLSFADPNLSLARVAEFLDASNRLRTIIFHDTEEEVSSSFLDMNIIPRFQYLRMLNLSRSCFEVLPSSIGSMRHMRYLDLSRNGKIEELPRSVYKLQSLQTLKLDGCSELKTLPKKIGKLISLRFLGITTKDWYMPESGIGCLSSLRFLKFEGCKYLQTLFEDIQHLQKLQTLLIYKCRSLTSLPLGMSSLSLLKTLVISDCENLNLLENPNGLRLRSLVLEDLPQLEALPEWLKGSAGTLEYMRIEYCRNLCSLPEWLQHFQSLQELVLTRCHLLSSLPEGMRRLSALSKLRISYCSQLTSKCQRQTGEDWNKIARVPEIYVDSIKQ